MTCHRSIRKLALTLPLALPLILAACAPATTPVPETRVEDPAPVAPPEETEEVEETAAALPDIARLTGLNPREVQTLMGEPALVRRDTGVQVMLYENDRCVLEVVFYEPTADAWFEVRQVNARTRKGQDTDKQTCLVDLLPGGRWHTDP